MSDERHPQEEERDVAALLHAVGARSQPPAELRERWEARFREELQQRKKQRRRRAAGLLATAASLLIAVAGGLWALRPASPPSPDIIVATVTGLAGGGALRPGDAPLVPGQPLAPGTRVATPARGFVALDYRGYDLRLNASTDLVLFVDRVELNNGEVYISGDGVRRGITVRTPHGDITDIGTQFLVTVQQDATTTRVRTGRVSVNNSAGEFSAAGDGMVASELRFDREDPPLRRDIAARGGDWAWIYTNAPAYSLDGSNAHDFLTWAASETGRQLEYADETTRRYARSTVLRGDIADLDPERSVHAVLLTTDLRASADSKGSLRVELLRGAAASDPKSR